MPPGRQRNIRKRKSDDAEEEEEAEDPVAVRERVEAAKLLQRQRARPTGMDAAALAVQKDTLSSALERNTRPQNDVLDAFSKEQVREYGDVELDPHMQKYVDEQMEKRMGVKRQDEAAARSGPMDPEQQLYVTPDELKIAPVVPAEVPGSWLTGIAEVQLPAHYKLKNIEETEAVKKRMLQDGLDSDGEGSGMSGSDEHRLVRGQWPRGFGRESDKHKEVRTTNLVKKSGSKPRR